MLKLSADTHALIMQVQVKLDTPRRKQFLSPDFVVHKEPELPRHIPRLEALEISLEDSSFMFISQKYVLTIS